MARSEGVKGRWELVEGKPKAMLRLYRDERVEAKLDGPPPHPVALPSNKEQERQAARRRGGAAVEPRLDSFVTVEPEPRLRLVPRE